MRGSKRAELESTVKPCVCVFCSWCNKDMHNGNYECDCQGVNRGENENDDENEYDVI